MGVSKTVSRFIDPLDKVAAGGDGHRCNRPNTVAYTRFFVLVQRTIGKPREPYLSARACREYVKYDGAADLVFHAEGAFWGVWFEMPIQAWFCLTP
jgi:hypothetical protein